MCVLLSCAVVVIMLYQLDQAAIFTSIQCASSSALCSGRAFFLAKSVQVLLFSPDLNQWQSAHWCVVIACILRFLHDAR